MPKQQVKDLYAADIFATNPALDWVGDAFSFQSHDLITDHPWAKTIKLNGAKDVAFLKILPAASGKSANPLGLISSLFPTQVPMLIKSDPQAGYYLYRNHAGQDLTKDANFATRQAILLQYADMQITALQHQDIAESLPQIKCADQYDRLLRFLAAAGDKDSILNAAYYMSANSAAQYHAIFLAAADMFRPFLNRGDAMTPTLNHCDLRPNNIAQKADGSLVFYDWDDAVYGPPGLSLPAMFGGAKRCYKAIENFSYITNNSQRQQDRQLLGSYVVKLSTSDAYSRDQLVKSLPAIICAGAIQYIVSFEAYPVKSRRLRDTIAKNIRRRLSDLMDLAHYLAMATPETQPALVAALNDNGRKNRATRLTDRSRKYRDNTAGPLPNALAKRPSQASLLTRADAGDVFPAVEITKDEQRTGVISAENRDLSVALFKRHGAVMLKNAMPLDLVNSCHDEFHTLYHKYLQKDRPDDALRVGDKRFMVTLKFDGVFANPALYASPHLMPILNALLGKDAILGSLTAVASLPGSTDQRMHKDNTALFQEAPGLITPSVSIALIVPLIALDRETGATRIVKGSHRIKSGSKNLPYQDPVVDLGSCYLMDSRLSHRGMANNSKLIRPIVSLVYQRPWYRDHINFKQQKPLDISKNRFNKTPKALQHLVSWAVE